MPEGDTIRTVCRLLSAELTGAGPVRVGLRRLDGRPLCGRTIVGLWSKGKHLFIGFDNGLVLRSHLGLHGSWHRYAPGEPWRKPQWQASVVVQDDDRLFVCFNAREVEILPEGGFSLLDSQHRLGPDLTREAADAGALVGRARALLDPGLPLSDVLLDQRVASGIGNVYKCEVLFLGGRHPLETLGDTPDGALAGLYVLARDLLGRNLAGGLRVTRFVDDGRGRLWVYGRHGAPCLRCGAVLRRDRLGVSPRPTWWCPGCQPQRLGTGSVRSPGTENGR